MTKGFQINNYHSQRFNIHGFPISRKAGESNSRMLDQPVSDPWPHKGSTGTLKTLLERRKSEMKPDISFDITGDGCISSKELMLALQFDKDQDGKLNTDEKQKLLDALADGYEKKFSFGLDATGAIASKDPAVQ